MNEARLSSSVMQMESHDSLFVKYICWERVNATDENVSGFSGAPLRNWGRGGSGSGRACIGYVRTNHTKHLMSLWYIRAVLVRNGEYH